jgi:aromatic ring-opening dioxygenase LigB subunit
LQVAPLSVGVGALLLDRCSYSGPILLRTVTTRSTVEECRAVAANIATAADRVGLLVIADGSARRTVKAPGYLDPRAEPYDKTVENAVATGDLGALHHLDPGLAEELMAPGWAALQVLAAAFAGNRPQTTVSYAEAPFGVGYLVATIKRG